MALGIPQNSTRMLSLWVSLPMVLVLIWVLPVRFDRFMFDTTHKQIAGSRDFNRVVYHDLDSDGYSERIILQNDTYSKEACFEAYTNNGHILGQVNLRGSLIHFNHVFEVGRLFDSTYHDLALVTIKKDSLLLNLVNMELSDDGAYLETKLHVVFLDRIRKNKGGGYDFSGSIKFRDTNRDGNMEVFIGMAAGFSIEPRKLYKYDLVKQKLYKSDTDGACGNHGIGFVDLDRDGIEEVVGFSYACWNISDTINYRFHDHNAYVMVFDSALNFFFDPIVEYGAYKNLPYHVLENKPNPLIVTVNGTPTQALKFQTLNIYNHKRQVVNRINFPHELSTNNYLLNHRDDRNLIWVNDRAKSELIGLSKELKEIKKIEMPFENTNFLQLDLFNDGNKSFLFYNLYKGLFSLSIDGKEHPIPDMPIMNPKAFEVTMKYNGPTQPPVLSVFCDDREHLICIRKNPYRAFRYPYYLLVVVLVYAAVFFVLNFQSKSITRRYQDKERLRDLELASAHGQLDPHFTFNAMNAIGASILTGNKKEAYEYFAELSQLIRLTLEKAKDSAQSLEQEIEFVKKYLVIEKFRFEERLHYTISEHGTINKSLMVPKMLMQIFVENAIKHGINPKKEGGTIHIKLTAKNHRHTIVIEDDGVGRTKAKELNTTSTGRGLKVMNEYVTLFNRQNKTNISYRMNDLLDGAGLIIGTRVVIELG